MHDAMYVNPGQMHLIRIHLTDLDNMFSFNDTDLTRHGRRWIEVAGCAAKLQGA